jgi:hypothetical protein
MDGDAKVERERMWRGHLAAWRTSGLSQAEYCRQRGLTQTDFSWWKRELARRTAAAAPTFVPVCIAAPPGNPYAFELALRGGRVLRFDARVDPAELSAVVRVLESAGLKPGDAPC